MAENPLLPDAELRRLYSLLQTAQKAEAAAARRLAKSAAASPGATAPSPREALLAATLVQLCPGDLLVTGPGETAAGPLLLSAARETPEGRCASLVELPARGSLLWSSATAAASLQGLGQGGLVLTFTRVGLREPTWAGALTWAQDRQLPLVVACADPSGAKAFRATARSPEDALHWTSLARVARRLGLPVLSVDGADAVAVYRVMQESVLRARASGGPAVLWAILPEAARGFGTEKASVPTPLRRLKQFLHARGIRP